jgi:hypothetical protein
MHANRNIRVDRPTSGQCRMALHCGTDGGDPTCVA